MSPAQISVRDANLPVVWVSGGPGSGKSTQCQLIVERYGFTHLSIGKLLRDEVATGSERSKELAAIMKSGDLVPSEVAFNLIKESMLSQLSTAKGFLIDSCPRKVNEGIIFERELSCTSILYFDASLDTMIKRVMKRAAISGRADDNEESIKMRLKIFMEQSTLALQHFVEKVRRINAELPLDEVFSQVKKAMDEIIKQNSNTIE